MSEPNNRQGQRAEGRLALAEKLVPEFAQALDVLSPVDPSVFSRSPVKLVRCLYSELDVIEAFLFALVVQRKGRTYYLGYGGLPLWNQHVLDIKWEKVVLETWGKWVERLRVSWSMTSWEGGIAYWPNDIVKIAFDPQTSAKPGGYIFLHGGWTVATLDTIYSSTIGLPEYKSIRECLELCGIEDIVEEAPGWGIGGTRPIGSLEKWIFEADRLITPEQIETRFEEAKVQLRTEGESGSNALTKLLLELALCRSPKIGIALSLVEHVKQTAKLMAAVKEVASASGSNDLVSPPPRQRFPHEINNSEYPYRIAWTDGTAKRIRRKAKQILQNLEKGSA